MGPEDQSVSGYTSLKGKFQLAPSTPLHGERLCPLLPFFFYLTFVCQYCCNILRRNHDATAILQWLQAAKHNTKSFRHLSESVKSLVQNPQRQGLSLLLSTLLSQGSSCLWAEELREEVQDLLPQVPFVTYPAQLQDALQHHLRLCEAQAQPSDPAPPLAHPYLSFTFMTYSQYCDFFPISSLFNKYYTPLQSALYIPTDGRSRIRPPASRLPRCCPRSQCWGRAGKCMCMSRKTPLHTCPFTPGTRGSGRRRSFLLTPAGHHRGGADRHDWARRGGDSGDRAAGRSAAGLSPRRDVWKP